MTQRAMRPYPRAHGWAGGVGGMMAEANGVIYVGSLSPSMREM